MEIYDDLSIDWQVQVLHRHLDNEIVQTYIRHLHVPEMEPSYLPQLLLYELAQGHHDLPMLIVVGAII
jgi:hypothetical protein